MASRETEVIRLFAAALDGAWPAASALLESTDHARDNNLLGDWFQSMWEMLVEASFGGVKDPVFLEIYGDGADCNGATSRVYQPTAIATHAIHCFDPQSDRITDQLMQTPVEVPAEGLPVDRLVSLDGSGWYADRPPFDHVLVLQHGNPAVFRLDGLEFRLAPIEGARGG